MDRPRSTLRAWQVRLLRGWNIGPLLRAGSSILQKQQSIVVNKGTAWQVVCSVAHCRLYLRAPGVCAHAQPRKLLSQLVRVGSLWVGADG